MKKQVIIIGAGPAGLTAGYELLKKSKNYNITILEENKIVGGISKTINYKGNRMDLGGHRFFTKNDRVNNFWNEILPAEATNKKNKDKVMLTRRRVSRIYYLKKFFDYPVSLKWETIKNLGFIRTIQSGFSYLKSIVFKKKEDNLENFYINRFGKKLYSMFFEKYTEKLWGRHPREIDSSWGAQRVKGLSIIAVIKDMFSKVFKFNIKKETSLIEEFKYPKYGPGQLWECVEKEIIKMGGKVIKESKVTEIKTKGKKIISVNCNGKEYKGDIFISSMPIKDLINGMDNTPPKIKNIATDLPYRDFITIGVLVKKLKIKNKTKLETTNDLIPDCWIYVQEENIKMGRIQIFNNWSPYLVKNNNKTVWLGLEYFCTENDDFWNMSNKDLAEFGIDELVKMGIIDNEKDVVDYHIEKVKKAYPAYFDSYKDIKQVVDYLKEYNNLYCVGRNGQHRYNNMDHSMITSFLAIDHILYNKINKDSIWEVNTESEYHEEK